MKQLLFSIHVAVCFSLARSGNPPDPSCLGQGFGTIYCTNLAARADRTYYIAATEILWDYAPQGNILNNPPPGILPSEAWLVRGQSAIGSKYFKAVYKEFTDATFTQEKPRPAGFEHMGLIGPAIRAFVGETVKIIFYNNASFTTNLHAHGVLYDKTSEGAPYRDGSTAGDLIAPQQKWVYIWKMRRKMVDRFTSSKVWLYHSHLHEIEQITAGLFGPIVVYKRPGYGRRWRRRKRKKFKSIDLPTYLPSDIQQEVYTFMLVLDEVNSPLFERTFQKFMNASGNLTAAEGEALKADPGFVEGNVMHVINGYAFGNAVPLNMKYMDNVRWYLGTFGNEKDGPHTVHWHGNVAVHMHESVDVVPLLPASTATVDMEMDARGKWLYHCHVYDHIDAGMMSTYTVA